MTGPDHVSSEPVLAGFYPDPSVCRAGRDYYLVTSTFEYFPGIPVHHSTDLTTWTQIGAVFPDPGPFTVPRGAAGASRGFFAPSIRHHDGRFVVVTTSIEDRERGHVLAHATDPRGPWSAPVFVAGAIGIDPDLAWDEAGTCYLTWKAEEGGIAQARLDVGTGTLTSSPRTIWAGTGLAHPEGPHLFRRAGWWYLIVAEGGTDRGHCVSVARSRSVDGPYEAYAGNPILTHRSLDSPVQSTGHADLVEGPDGSWSAVHLAVRPRGTFPRFHVNGRETFLADVRWDRGWPSIEERADLPAPDRSFTDTFDAPDLHPRWIAPGRAPSAFAAPGRHGLTLARGRGAGDPVAEALLAVRATDPQWHAEVAGVTGDLALSVRIDDRHWFAVERVGDQARVRMVVGPLDQVLAVAPAGPDAGLVLRAVADEATGAGPDRLVAGVADDRGFRQLACVDGRYLSTEVAGGFTGRVIGLEALGGEAHVVTFTLRAGIPG